VKRCMPGVPAANGKEKAGNTTKKKKSPGVQAAVRGKVGGVTSTGWGSARIWRTAEGAECRGKGPFEQ